MQKSSNLLGQSQNEMNITTLDDYANHQFKSLQRTEVYKDDWKYVKTISKFILTEDMVKCIKTILSPVGNPSG